MKKINVKSLTAFTVRDFSFWSRGRNLKAWPPRSPRSANIWSALAPSVPACTGCWPSPARMMPQASRFCGYPAGTSKTGWPDACRAAHGCPSFLRGRAFPAMLGQAGGHKQAAAAWAWTSGLAMSVALAGNASRRNAIPICRVQSPLLPVFQDRRFSKSNHASGREPCISIIRPGDCAAGPITATS